MSPAPTCPAADIADPVLAGLGARYEVAFAAWRASDSEVADSEMRVVWAAIAGLHSADPAVQRLKLRALADVLERPVCWDAAITAALREAETENALALSIARDLADSAGLRP